VDEHHVDIAAPCGIEGLARSLGDELEVNPGLTLVDSLELREQPGILKACRGGDPEDVRTGGGCGRRGARRLVPFRRSPRAPCKGGEDEKEQDSTGR